MRKIAATTAIVLMLFTVLPLQTMVFAQECCPTGDGSFTTTYHEIVLFQGDNPNTDEVEQKERVWVLDRSRWTVPWNASYIYISVPEEAENLTIDHVELFQYVTGSVFLPGRYSWRENPDNRPVTERETEGAYAGYYFWKFPQGADKSVSEPLYLNDTTALENFDEQTTNSSHWNIENGRMSLENGIPNSTYVSQPHVYGYNIVSVNASWDKIANEQNMSISVSNDNGTTWTQVQNATEISLSGTGNEFRWRLTMSQDIALNNTPNLENLTLTLKYIPEELDLWLQATYELPLEEDGLEFTIHLSFHGPSSSLILLGYFDPDVEFQATGVDVTKSVQEDYPGKEVYRHMMGPYETCLSFQIQEQRESSGSDFMWIAVAAVLILFLAGIFFRVKIKKTKKEKKPAPKRERKELLEEKEKLQEMIERVDAEEESGLIEKETAEEMREDYQRKIDAIDKELESLAQVHESNQEDIEKLKELEEQKEMVLLSIKNLDEELEEGTICKEDYERFRAGYKKKAVKILKELDRLQISRERSKSQVHDRDQLLEEKKRLRNMMERVEKEAESGLMDEEVAQEMQAEYQMKVDEIDKRLAETPGKPAAHEAPKITEEELESIEELEEQKERVLQSIKDLDKELEDGSISREDYERFRAGYKKKAVEILKELDELEKGNR